MCETSHTQRCVKFRTAAISKEHLCTLCVHVDNNEKKKREAATVLCRKLKIDEICCCITKMGTFMLAERKYCQ